MWKPSRSTLLCASIVLLLTYVLLQEWQAASDPSSSSSSLVTKTNRIRNRVSGGASSSSQTTTEESSCWDTCMEKANDDQEDGDYKLLNMTRVGRLVRNARNELIRQLENDYGADNVQRIFFEHQTANTTITKAPVSRGRKVILPASGKEGGISIQRFKRKLKLKVLTMQRAVRKDLCPCAADNNDDDDGLFTDDDEYNDDMFAPQDAGRHRRAAAAAHQHQRRRRTIADSSGSPVISNNDKNNKHYYTDFVWATGGHSAAAGHGNLLNQSYTAVLESAIAHVFGAIRIRFEGRNYAMGGTSSAPEIALCQEAIFGSDADVVTWDYGMTDAGRPQKKAMYDARLGLHHPNKPAMIGINVVERDFGGHSENVVKSNIEIGEEHGLTALYLDPTEFAKMKDAIPETFGLNETQINQMPPMVRYFKCQEALEKGDPYCGDKKYDNDKVCQERNGMVSWHPGWKMMALWGNTFALFLADMLLDAIDELKLVNTTDDLLLNQLMAEEEADSNTFVSSTSAAISDYELIPKEGEFADEVNASVFFTKPSICHTARLPSQSRYLGIVTESPDKRGVFDYDKGINVTAARNMVSGNGTVLPMPLVMDEAARQQNCPVELNRDYKDWFFASSKIPMTTLTIPNDAEMRAYAQDNQQFLGILVMCLVGCDWGRCQEGELREEHILNGQVRMEVNGNPVTNNTDFMDSCSILRGEQGHRWQANDEGRYVLTTRVIGNGTDFSFLRVSSFVLL